MKTLSRIVVGLALAAPLTITSAVRADDKTSSSDNKQDVTMSDLPKPVKSTVQREAKGKNVESMTKSTNSSGTVAYEIKYLDGSKETTLDVASNGKILGRHVQDTPNGAQATPPSNQNNPPGTQSNQINKDTQNKPKDTQNNPSTPQSTQDQSNQINHDTDNHAPTPPANDGKSNDTKPNDTRQSP